MIDTLRRIFYFLVKPEFTVIIRDRAAQLLHGKLRRETIEDFTVIAESRGINEGMIFGVKEPGRIKLRFSSTIAESNRQRFRNVFVSV